MLRPNHPSSIEQEFESTIFTSTTSTTETSTETIYPSIDNTHTESDKTSISTTEAYHTTTPTAPTTTTPTISISTTSTTETITKTMNPSTTVTTTTTETHEAGSPTFHPCSFQKSNPSTDVGRVSLPDGTVVNVSCTEGWMTWLRRKDGSVNFQEPWEKYKKGFGDLKSEFWLGLDMLHRITKTGGYRMQAKIRNYAGDWKVKIYDNFKVGSEEGFYQLTLSNNNETGNSRMLPDVLDGAQLSTVERDHDGMRRVHCARAYRGGWWHKDGCSPVNPTGR